MTDANTKDLDHTRCIKNGYGRHCEGEWYHDRMDQTLLADAELRGRSIYKVTEVEGTTILLTNWVGFSKDKA